MRKLKFWTKYVLIELLYLLMFFVGIFLFPVAYFLEYVIDVRNNPLSWFLNPTVDGDFGAKWWRKREGIKKKNFFVAYRWFFRNPTWRFRMMLAPVWNGEFTIVEVVKNTLNPQRKLGHKLDWADRDAGIYGTNHVYYEVNGKLYGRYSHASERFEFAVGAGGDMWRFRLKIGKKGTQESGNY